MKNPFLKGSSLFFTVGLLVTGSVSLILSKSIREGEKVTTANENNHHPTTLENNLLGKSEDELKTILTPLQFKVTKKEGTERPFSNTYWDNKEDGLYVDIISGKPLFSSSHKFESGTGWPSFFKPVDEAEIIEKKDSSFGMVRTEVRSKTGDSHLGHVFEDGPAPTGLRYCINSASLRFVPKEKLKEEGYEKYLALFSE